MNDSFLVPLAESSKRGTVCVAIPRKLERLCQLIRENRDMLFHHLLDEGGCEVSDVRDHIYELALIAVLSQSLTTFEHIAKFLTGQNNDALPAAALRGWLHFHDLRALDVLIKWGVRIYGESNQLTTGIDEMVDELEQVGQEAEQRELARMLSLLEFDIELPCCRSEMVQSAWTAGAIPSFFEQFYVM